MTNKITVKTATEALSSHAKHIEHDPEANSVFAYAHDLFQMLEDGRAEIGDMETLIQDVFVTLLEERAEKFKAQHTIGENDVWACAEEELTKLANKGWDAFREAVESSRGGIVFTGHPTFALSQKLRSSFASKVSDVSVKEKNPFFELVRNDEREWSKNITLFEEHKEAQEALANAQNAMHEFAGRIIDVAKENFPKKWTSLRPQLPTIASWLGYDLDGRTDIHWSQSFAFRLNEKAVQLTRYAKTLSKIENVCEHNDLKRTIGEIVQRIEAAADITGVEAKIFSKDLAIPKNLVDAANTLTAENDARIKSTDELLELIDGLIDAGSVCRKSAKALLILRAQIQMLQLGTARIHLRLNAAQIGTVISRDLNLETEHRDPDRGALRKLAKKAETAEALKVNFADLFLEQSSARRQFMMCAQILKHVDASSCIRFLIAESENPATVMAALYLARQYGVAEQLDISPLFETPRALETGGRFIEQLLKEPVYLSYLKSRGYLAIQLGFSDAGRFIGQVSADMAIERIHNLISIAVSQTGTPLELLIFNTHGESMGRGAWPGTFKQRFDHLLSGWTRYKSRKRGVPIKHEVSFQGGDGFLHFANPALAESTYAAFAAHLFEDIGEDVENDPFYSRTDLVWDFYRALRQWHERLFDNEDYGRLLGDFATSFLVKAGSRQRRRASGPRGPRSLRAISHNATLQQIAAPLNTAAGIGSALRREHDQIIEVIKSSPRMRGLIRLAANARTVTSVPALRAYGRVFDPSFWVALTRRSSDENALAYRRIYYLLQQQETSSSIEKIANVLSIDLIKFDPILAQMDSVPSAEERHEARGLLHILHSIRQALMMKALSLAGRLPLVSRRHEDSVIDIMNQIKAMHISTAVEILKEIFPASRTEEINLQAIEEQGHMAGNPANGYDELHSRIIEPLEQIDRQLHMITLAVSQAYGAYG